MSADSFGARSTLEVAGLELEIFRVDALAERFDVAHLPFSLKILLENLLRNEGKGDVTATHKVWETKEAAPIDVPCPAALDVEATAESLIPPIRAAA